MNSITEAEIEIVARAIAVGHGADPDERTPLAVQPDGTWAWYWQLWIREAVTQISAYRAIAKLGMLT